MERTLDNLRSAFGCNIYIDLGKKFESADRFVDDAKAQGWTMFGEEPVSDRCTRYVLLKEGRDIRTLTTAGIMLAQAHAVLTVDYQKFADGEDNYIRLPQR